MQQADFDVGGEIAALSEGRRDVGAIASFVGLVRDLNDGSGVSAMTLEHYPGMTEKALEEIVEQARQRWSLQGVRGDSSLRATGAGGSHRLRRRRQARIGAKPSPPASSHHGLPEDPRAVLEMRGNARGGTLGRCARDDDSAAARWQDRD